MHFPLISTLKSKAEQIGANSFLYDWSLSGKAPDRLVVRPVDTWTGSEDKALALLSAAGVEERTGPQWYAQWWNPEDGDDIWISHIHSFVWLRDLRTLNTARAREQGRVMLKSWIDNHGNYSPQCWRAEITGRRVAMWICHYDFFCDGDDHEFDEAFLSSLAKQANHLANICKNIQGIAQFEAVKGLLFAGIALESREKWIDQALTTLKKAIETQILPDGGHKTRSPATMLDVLEILTDIRTALKAANYPAPDILTGTIENTGRALRLFQYRDRRFGLFQGAQEGENEMIDAILAQAGTHKPAHKRLEQTGFERIEIGRSLLVMDTGIAQNAPYDKQAHAAPLAFEFCYGKERVFANCGAHPTCNEWQEALRSTAAHNTACLDMRGAYEIKKDGSFGRKASQTEVHREETKDAALLVASHNAYAPLNGITHLRKIYLCDEGNDLRGEDDFTCAFTLVKPVDIALRFHLYPSITITPTEGAEEFILRMPGGIGWRFIQSGGTMQIEDSLSLANGITPRKTKQIVIHKRMSSDNTAIKWSLKREG